MIVNKSMLKNAVYSIFKNKKLILLISLINIISFGMLLCNNSYPKDMKNTIIKYYEKTNQFDVYLSANTGFNEGDVKTIKDLDFVKGVSLSKELKVKASIKNKDYNIKAISIDPKRNLKSNDYINRLTLTTGKYPSTINEGLIDENLFNRNNLSLGDLVTLTVSDNNLLRAKKIKIVGTVKNNLHVDKEEKDDKENKNDINNHYIYLEENNFTSEYNEMYITIKDDNKYDIYSTGYEKMISDKKDEILKVMNSIIEDRKKSSLTYLNNELENQKNTLNSLYELELPDESLSSDIEKINNEINKINNKINTLNEDKLYSTVKVSSTNFREYKNDVNNTNKILYIVSVIIFILFLMLNVFLICKLILKEKTEIKTLKALGYSNFNINIKYFLVILISHLISFIVLILLLKKIIPLILWMYYKKVYSIPFIQPSIEIWPVVTLLLVNIAFIVLFADLYFVYRKKKYVK